MQNSPERRGTIVRYSIDGTISRFFPAQEESPQANWDALEQALTGLQDGDHVVLDQFALYEKGDAGDGIEISGFDNIKISNGYLVRDTSISFNGFLEFNACTNFVVENMTLDGRAGVSAPTDEPPTHQNDNANATSSCNLIDINNCQNSTVKNCRFRDVITNETFSGDNPQYPGARGITIDSDCAAIRVEGCLFKLMGYAGVRDDGISTHVVGCTFDDCQWHGYVFNGGGTGHTKIQDCYFTRLSSTTLGFPGCINFNPGSVCEKVSIINCSTYFPYDFVANTEGTFMAKIQDVETLIVRDCNFRHGLNGSVGQGMRSSLRFQAYIGRAFITDSWLDGAIWHITWDGTPYDLTIENSTINGSSQERWGMFVGAKNITFKNSDIYYHQSAVAKLSAFVPTTEEITIQSSQCRYIPDDSRDSYIFEIEYLEKNPHQVKFDSSNVIQVSGMDMRDGGGSSFEHAKSDTTVGNLIMTTTGDNPLVKLYKSTLSGDQAHTMPSGSLPDGPFFPDISGFGGLEIKNQNWVAYSGGPSGIENVDYWKWDVMSSQFVTRGIL